MSRLPKATKELRIWDSEELSRPTTVLWAAGSDDNVFVVEVTDPKEDLR